MNQYYLSNDPTKIPTPIDADVSLEGGILLLNSDEASESDKDFIPQSGGLVGTVKSLFRVIGLPVKKEELPLSKDVSIRKRRGGLYDDKVK